MLQSIRDRIQGWIAGTIIGLLVLTFALWGVQSYLGTGGGPAAVAKVDGKIITQQQVENAYQHLRQALQQQTNGPLALNTAAQTQLKQQALQQLITQQVLSHAALDAGFRVSQAQLDSVIYSLPAFQNNGKFSPDRFQQVLNATNYTPQQFFADLQQNLLINQMQSGISTSSLGLTNEAEQAYLLSNQQRSVAYLIVPAARFLKNVPINSAEINNYYQQHLNDYKTQERVSIQYIELSPTKMAQQVKISDPELQQYYQTNLQSYTKNGKPLPFAEVKNDIEKLLVQQKVQEQFASQSEQLSQLTYTNPSSLTSAATALNLPVQESSFITREGGDKTGIMANPQIINAAFSDDVLKNKNNSNPISLSDGTVVVLRVKDYEPAAVQPLAAVTSAVEQSLREQQAQNAAQKQGAEILQTLQKADNLEAAAVQPFHLNWQSKNSVTRQAPGVNPQILRAAFALPKPNSADKPSITGIALANGDYAIVAVKEIISASTPSEQQLRVFQHEIQNNYSELENQLLVKDALAKAKVKILN